jgi:glutathione-regulated potassium-efflux system ancillary protein KefG
MPMNKILVLLFHPRLESSKVNKFFSENLSARNDIYLRDMYELYPDFNIDIPLEQKNLLEADLVIMQHPFYWYSVPPMVKQWIDLVLQHGWAYGREGDKLKGKKILHLISSGGTFEAYNNTGRNKYTYRELLRPLELTYRLCLMKQLPPYIIPGSNKIDPEVLKNHWVNFEKALDWLKTSENKTETEPEISYLNDLI